MSNYQTPAEVVKQEQLAPEIFRLSLSARFVAETAKPGQFVMLRPTTSYDPLLGRPFSIHQTMANGLIQILYKVIGRGTALMSQAKPGDLFNVVGPLGNEFKIHANTPSILVGGGMGIAPLLFLAKKLIQQKEACDIAILLGGRNKQDLHVLQKDFQSLGLSPLCATDDGSMGLHGFVTDLMGTFLANQKIGDGSLPCAYVCGPRIMMEKIAKVCMAQKMTCQVSMETVMACGVGACLGCTIEAKKTSEGGGHFNHVCKDGPVFDASVVQWGGQE